MSRSLPASSLPASLSRSDNALRPQSSRVRPLRRSGTRPPRRRVVSVEALEPRAMLTVWAVPTNFPTISAAIASPQVLDFDTVEVAAGTYVDNIVLDRPLTVRGAGRDLTILQGRSGVDRPVVLVRDVENATLEGLTFSHGRQGGLEIQDASPLVVACEIRDNQRESIGSAVYVHGDSSPVLMDNLIHGNIHPQGSGHSGGFGAVYDASFGSSTYVGNEVYGNDSWYAGAIYLVSGTPIVHDNYIHDNVSDHGGGIVVTGGSPTIENNRIVKNRHDSFGDATAGIDVTGGDAVIRFNTLADNDGDGVYVGSLAQAELMGNIVARHARGVVALAPITLSTNDVWNPTAVSLYVGPGIGAIVDSLSLDPLLDSTYRPTANSPAIDHGPANIRDLGGSRSDLGSEGGRGTAASATYRVDTIVAGCEQNVEQRVYQNDFHFLSFIVTGGALPYRQAYQNCGPSGSFAKHSAVFRTHPDQADANGWGSTIYMSPFISGGDAENSRFTDLIVTSRGVYVKAAGAVAKNAAGDSYGEFSTWRSFAYDATTETLRGQGRLNVDLSGPLANAPGDLNVMRIASNKMPNVPLVGGGTGDTGDTARVDYQVGDLPRTTWNPTATPLGDSGTFPGEQGDSLYLGVVGDVNRVDTLAQGHPDAIAVARKPTVDEQLTLRGGDSLLSFGGFYPPDLSERQAFQNDNVAALALVHRNSTQRAHFVFDLDSASSVPGAADATSDVRLLGAEVSGAGTLTLNYLVADGAAQPFQLHLAKSTDRAFDTGDSALGSVVRVESAAQLSVGAHVLSIPVGAGAERWPLPGLGASSAEDDHYLLIVAAPLRTPTVAHTLSADTARLTGVYQATNGDLYVHGTSGPDSAELRGSGGVVLNGRTTARIAPAAAAYRVFLHDGDDTFRVSGTSLTKILAYGGAGADSLEGGPGADVLDGGTGDDVFRFDADARLGSDTLRDSAGFDWLDFSSTNRRKISLDLARTAPQNVNDFLRLTLIGSRTFEGVLGGALADVLRGDDGANVLVGGPGNDTLDGRGGADLLYGGAGADLLLGGGGDDLLVGGVSPYESNRQALYDQLRAWNTNDTYSTRIANLRSGGVQLVPRITVLNDDAVDTLYGGTERDWYLLSTKDKLRDRVADEVTDFL